MADPAVVTVQVSFREIAEEIAEKFWLKADRSGGPDSCWIWSRGKTVTGYGVVQFQGRLVGAHRVAFFLIHGRFPTSCALHRCDTPSCVNPSHIFEGTMADNMADCVAKGRRPRGDLSGSRKHPERVPRGSRHWKATLGEESAIAIRELSATGVPQKVIAAMYSVSQSTISRVVTGKLWRHV